MPLHAAQQHSQPQQHADCLERFLGAGVVEIPLGDDRVRLTCTPLPGRAACVAARDADGILWIAFDDGKPWARGQLAEMLADAYEMAGGCPFERGGEHIIDHEAMRAIPIQRRGRDRLRAVVANNGPSIGTAAAIFMGAALTGAAQVLGLFDQLASASL